MPTDATVPAKADREPTAEEARIAEEQAKKVDLDNVADHAKEMAERGAQVKGEGQIEDK